MFWRLIWCKNKITWIHSTFVDVFKINMYYRRLVDGYEKICSSGYQERKLLWCHPFSVVMFWTLNNVVKVVVVSSFKQDICNVNYGFESNVWMNIFYVSNMLFTRLIVTIAALVTPRHTLPHKPKIGVWQTWYQSINCSELRFFLSLVYNFKTMSFTTSVLHYIFTKRPLIQNDNARILCDNTKR